MITVKPSTAASSTRRSAGVARGADVLGVDGDSAVIGFLSSSGRAGGTGLDRATGRPHRCRLSCRHSRGGRPRRTGVRAGVGTTRAPRPPDVPRHVGGAARAPQRDPLPLPRPGRATAHHAAARHRLPLGGPPARRRRHGRRLPAPDRHRGRAPAQEPGVRRGVGAVRRLRTQRRAPRPSSTRSAG